MWRSGTKLPLSTSASLAILLALTGCAEFRTPRIDPSGEHLFIYDPPPAAAFCPPGTVPAPAPTGLAVVARPPRPLPPSLRTMGTWCPTSAIRPVATPPHLTPYSDVAVTLTPFRIVEPVGSQVVMLASVRGGDNYLRTNRRLEWWLMPGSVGQFTAVGEKSFCDDLVATSPIPASSPQRRPSATPPAWPSKPAGREVASMSFPARGGSWSVRRSRARAM